MENDSSRKNAERNVGETTFIHPAAIVDSGAKVGSRTRVWPFSHILAGAEVGDDCNICEGVFIETGAVVGDRVTVKSGVQLWDGVRLSDDVFIGPNATFTNDQYPRSKEYPESFLTTIAFAGTSLVTTDPAPIIALTPIFIPGSIVALAPIDAPLPTIVVGNPARLQGYINGKRSRQTFSDSGENQNADLSIVDGCSTVRLKHIRDMRGDLTELSFIRDLPFEPKRVFTITGVPDRKIRGEHAHIKCHQFLVCVQGSVTAMADDGRSRQEYTLDSPALGLYMPPMIWHAR